jgi:4-methyl-5(b-hydroxyethyl)-thiazole monophosphate biosynthesis
MIKSDSVDILLFLAQGFEDLEAVSVIDVFGWTQYRDHIPDTKVITTGFHPTVTGRYGIKIAPDIQFNEIYPSDYKALVLPGGFHSHGFDEAYDPRIHELARNIHQNCGFIATMCVGVLPIADAGLLEGKKATTYSYSKNHDNFSRLKANGAITQEENIVIDNRIISCKGPGSSLEVAFLLMECLMGSSVANEVKKYMVYEL